MSQAERTDKGVKYAFSFFGKHVTHAGVDQANLLQGLEAEQGACCHDVVVFPAAPGYNGPFVDGFRKNGCPWRHAGGAVAFL
ncbi:MAG: hypothetical protein C0613_06740 [Desulfobulbaceae bacterium]|nr:MAG: hypothetical protein C0613_06740 [Desulfobulbaceae bacterium]